MGLRAKVLELADESDTQLDYSCDQPMVQAFALVIMDVVIEACAQECTNEALRHSYDEEHRWPFYDCADAIRRLMSTPPPASPSEHPADESRKAD